MNLTSKGLLLIPLLALTACSSVWASGPTCRHTPIAVSNPGEQPSSPVAKLGRLGFVRDGDVWVQDLTLRSEQNLTHDGHSGFPRWSASGAWIGIGTQMSTAGVGGSANEQVVSMRWDGSERNVIGTGSIADVASAVWSPTGDRIAFIEADHGVVINADGSARVELANATSLAWSPDGAWLAYVKFERLQLGQDARRPFPHRVSIWRVRAHGTDEHLVLDGGVPSPDFIEVAGWSPDRAEILFWRNTGFSGSVWADGSALAAVPVGGGPPTVIVPKMLAYPDFMDWAPDSQHLALVQGSYRSTWFRKSIAVGDLGASLQKVSPDDYADLFPSWSPDGQWLAYATAPAIITDGGNDARAASSERRVALMRADGTDRHLLTNTPGLQDERPRWSRDGHTLLFTRVVGGQQAQLWLIDTDGTSPRMVADNLDVQAATGLPAAADPAWFGYYGYLHWSRMYDWWQPVGVP